MYPLGLAPDESGNGTTPEGLQQILSCRYSQPGVIAGIAITASATLMQIAIGAGAAAVQLASGLLVEVPVAPINLSLAAAPASGSRTDIVAVSGTTGQLSIVSAVPAGSQEVGRVIVPAGATRGADCTVSTDRLWALLRGVSQGVLGTWVDASPVFTELPTAKTTLCSLRIPPQAGPRQIEVHVQASIAHASASGSCRYELLVDGVVEVGFVLGYNTWWESRSYRHVTTLTAGVAHTIAVTRVFSAGTRGYIFGGPQAGTNWPRNAVRIVDIAAARA